MTQSSNPFDLQTSQSIVSNRKECLVCKTTHNLHRHHIFYGKGYRMLSEKYGCWCYLCAYHHNMSNYGVHNNKIMDNRLKKKTQVLFEEKYPNINFIEIFGKNYKEEK